jgi:hypothetical protein
LLWAARAGPAPPSIRFSSMTSSLLMMLRPNALGAAQSQVRKPRGQSGEGELGAGPNSARLGRQFSHRGMRTPARRGKTKKRPRPRELRREGVRAFG